MRLRLLIRRLTVSAPRMAVRSALPWPLRWVVLATVFGFCAAIALWAFEFGKDIAGLDRGIKEELQQARLDIDQLRNEAASLKDARDKAQAVANTVDTLLTSEKVAQEKLVQQVKQLEDQNQAMRDDLGFFEKLIPAPGGEAIAIRGLQAELRNGHQIKWQILVIQSQKNAPEFSARLELSFTGLQSGRPWSAALPGGAQDFKLRQYGRMDGVFDLPAQTVVKGLSAKVLDGNVVKATQSIKL
jgi:hypothetical protein